MSFGLNIFDEKGVQTFGMDDFTLQLLYSIVLPASNLNGIGRRSDYMTIDVPGYDPSTGVVVITPTKYANYEQGAGQPAWGFLPTYRDLGGTSIALYLYVNYGTPDGGGGGKYREIWKQFTVECTVEVFRRL